VSEINVAQPPLSAGYETVPGMGHLLGYARVSTTDQQPQLQVDALERAGCYRVFTETASGARADRPTLEQLLDQLRPGDTLVVWKLDRLGRSLRHLVDTVTGLADRGIGFRSLQEAIDTTTPGGKLVFHVFAALAEFERDLIRERTGWPRRCTARGSAPLQRSPPPSELAAPRSTATWPTQAANLGEQVFGKVRDDSSLLVLRLHQRAVQNGSSVCQGPSGWSLVSVWPAGLWLELAGPVGHRGGGGCDCRARLSLVGRAVLP
jgi:hypothetical protein